MENKIREFRKEMHLTQKQLADRLGVSHSTIQKWESGAVEMPGQALIGLCSVFGCEAEELYGLKPKHSDRNEMCDELVDIFYRMTAQGQEALVATARGLLGTYAVKNNPISDEEGQIKTA